MARITVLGTEISHYQQDEEDFICLTDMVKNIDNGLVLIEKWLRNKNTIEFLGVWKEINNPDFNSPEFEGIKNEAGLNRFINENLPQDKRLIKLNKIAIQQMRLLTEDKNVKKLESKGAI